jgi:hypothetical protein
VNYNHVMPTRYSVDISFDKANLNKETLKVCDPYISFITGTVSPEIIDCWFWCSGWGFCWVRYLVPTPKT